MISPPIISPGGSGISLRIDRAVVVFPAPVSPTIPRVSPLFSSKWRLLTASTVPPSALYTTDKFLISNNFLASIYMDHLGVGVAYVDNSTGELYTTESVSTKDNNLFFAIDELEKISPSEIICNKLFSSASL